MAQVTRPRLRHARRTAIVAVVLLFVAAGAFAAMTLYQRVEVSTSAVTPDVRFADGSGYGEANALGYATLAYPDAGAATIDLAGIPGGAVRYTDIFTVTNHGATDYHVTLARDGEPHAAITSYEFAYGNQTWDAATSAVSPTFTVAPGESVTFDARISLESGTAAGSLGGFTIEAAMAPS